MYRPISAIFIVLCFYFTSCSVGLINSQETQTGINIISGTASGEIAAGDTLYAQLYNVTQDPAAEISTTVIDESKEFSLNLQSPPDSLLRFVKGDDYKAQYYLSKMNISDTTAKISDYLVFNRGTAGGRIEQGNNAPFKAGMKKVYYMYSDKETSITGSFADTVVRKFIVHEYSGDIHLTKGWNAITLSLDAVNGLNFKYSVKSGKPAGFAWYPENIKQDTNHLLKNNLRS